MIAASHLVFDTALGRCGIAWRGTHVVATCLPEGADASVLAALSRRAGASAAGEPPAPVAAGVAAIRRLLAGAAESFGFLELDLEGVPDFDRRVYAAALAIPAGETRTYGEVARAIGEPDAARAVGRALGANPFPIVVPCHRVLAAGGAIGGFSAPGGVATNRRLLAIESAHAPLPLFAAMSAIDGA
jgi:methylated-DNA-[protein]-cysteine S-methyltransferase